MPATYIECPNCGWEGKIDETLVGRRLKCPKCATSFVAEVGGTYDLAEPAPTSTRRRPSGARSDRPAPKGSEPETEGTDEPDHKSGLEAWPEE